MSSVKMLLAARDVATGFLSCLRARVFGVLPVVVLVDSPCDRGSDRDDSVSFGKSVDLLP